MVDKFYFNFVNFDYFMNINFSMISKIKFLFLLLLFFNGCIQLPGINQEPKKRKMSDKISSEYSIDDVEINIINSSLEDAFIKLTN